MQGFPWTVVPARPTSARWLQDPLDTMELHDARQAWQRYDERLARFEQRVMWFLSPFFVASLVLIIAHPTGSWWSGTLLIGSVITFSVATLWGLPRQLMAQGMKNALTDVDLPQQAEFFWLLDRLDAAKTLRRHLTTSPRSPLYGELHALQNAHKALTRALSVVTPPATFNADAR